MLLCTVATNLKDCAPFGSLHRANLPAADLAEWQAAYDAGAALQKSGRLTQASAAFERAARIDGDYADLAFRRADCDHLSGQDPEAARFFRQARDEDALQFRADSRINQMIRQAAAAFADRRVSLVDAEELFATNSPRGLAGAEYFYEHVHLNPEGNYLLARSLAEQTAKALSLDTPGQWIPEPECLRLLGLTDWSRYDALQIILDRVQAPPFTYQLNHGRQLENLNEQLARYRLARKPAQVRLEARQVSEALAHQPEDADLHSILAVPAGSRGGQSGRRGTVAGGDRSVPQAVEPRLKLAQLLGAAWAACPRPSRSTTKACASTLSITRPGTRSDCCACGWAPGRPLSTTWNGRCGKSHGRLKTGSLWPRPWPGKLPAQAGNRPSKSCASTRTTHPPGPCSTPGARGSSRRRSSAVDWGV